MESVKDFDQSHLDEAFLAATEGTTQVEQVVEVITEGLSGVPDENLTYLSLSRAELKQLSQQISRSITLLEVCLSKALTPMKEAAKALSLPTEIQLSTSWSAFGSSTHDACLELFRKVSQQLEAVFFREVCTFNERFDDRTKANWFEKCSKALVNLSVLFSSFDSAKVLANLHREHTMAIEICSSNGSKAVRENPAVAPNTPPDNDFEHVRKETSEQHGSGGGTTLVEVKRSRGRTPLTDERRDAYRSWVQDWNGQGYYKTKHEFCESRNIPIEDFEKAQSWVRHDQLKQRRKEGG
ncbi:hypothetical protein K2Y11_08350 [bacterium]|nr:hypothetical protein [bacterium]